jgi:hypothetical protein
VFGLAAALLPGPALAEKAIWRSDLTKVRAPDKPATGKIAGQPFRIEGAQLRQNTLTLRQGKDFFADRQVTIFFFPKEGDKLQDRVIDIPTSARLGSPHIHMSWMTPGKSIPTTEIFMQGYVMRVYFGKPKAGKLTGRIHLCLPDKNRSFVAGNFSAVLK